MAAQVYTPAPRMFIPPPPQTPAAHAVAEAPFQAAPPPLRVEASPPPAIAEVLQPFLLVPPPIVEAPRPLAQMPPRLIAPPPEPAVFEAPQPRRTSRRPWHTCRSHRPRRSSRPWRRSKHRSRLRNCLRRNSRLRRFVPELPLLQWPRRRRRLRSKHPRPYLRHRSRLPKCPRRLSRPWRRSKHRSRLRSWLRRNVEAWPSFTELPAAGAATPAAPVSRPRLSIETPEAVAEVPRRSSRPSAAFETPEPVAEVPSPELEASSSYAELPPVVAAAPTAPAFETPAPVFETPEPVAEMAPPVVEAVAAFETPGAGCGTAFAGTRSFAVIRGAAACNGRAAAGACGPNTRACFETRSLFPKWPRRRRGMWLRSRNGSRLPKCPPVVEAGLRSKHRSRLRKYLRRNSRLRRRTRNCRSDWSAPPPAPVFELVAPVFDKQRLLQKYLRHLSKPSRTPNCHLGSSKP